MGAARRALAGATLLVVTATACVSPSRERAQPESPTARPIAHPTASTLSVERLRAIARDVLAKRAWAVRNGDRTLFMSLIDDGNSAFVAHEQQVFTNTQRLDFSIFGYSVLNTGVDPQTATVDGEVFLAWIVERYTIAGQARIPIGHAMVLTFVHRGTGWLISSDSDADDRLTVDLHQAPWQRDDFQVVTDQGVVVLGAGDAGAISRMRAIASAAVGAVDRVEATLGIQAPSRVVVDASPQLARFDNQPNVIAVSHWTTSRVRGWQRGGRAEKLAAMWLAVNPDYSGETGGRNTVLLTHEITQVVLGRWSGAVPSWMVEGVAEFVAETSVPPDLRLDRSAAVLQAAAGVAHMPSSGTFYTVDVNFNYALSWMACDLIASRYGADMLVSMYKQMNARDDADDPDIEAAQIVSDRLGISIAQLASQSARRLVRQLGP